MNILPRTIARRFPAIHATDGVPAEQKMVVAKWFDPAGTGTWYAFEADALVDEVNETWEPLAEVVGVHQPYRDVKFFGYVTGLQENGLGYFLLSEPEARRGHVVINGQRSRAGLPIERDIYYTPQSLADLQRQDG